MTRSKKIPYFQSTITVWPLEERGKGGQRLLEVGSERSHGSWWNERLGRDFIRKIPSREEHMRKVIYMESNPLESQVASRPLELPHVK